jgi:DNA-binding transcriptional ArsR family regulator
VSLAASNDYDEVFAALKHPIRRQILLLLEDKGELSFTEIQNALGLSDTGLISYHLKELATLIEQSGRGKYSLSEVGRASMTLLRKVEMEKDKTSKAVHGELEKLFGEAIFLFLIFGISLIAPLSVDISLSVENIGQLGVSIGQLFFSNLIGLLGMIFGVLLFIFYDRHYFTRNLRRNIIHATIFALVPAVVSISSVYVQNFFVEMASPKGNTLILSAGVLRGISLMIVAPILAYIISQFLERHSSRVL